MKINERLKRFKEASGEENVDGGPKFTKPKLNE